MTTPLDGPPDEGALLAKLARQVPGVLYQYRRFPDGRTCFPFASAGIRDVYEVEPAEVVDDAGEWPSAEWLLHLDSGEEVLCEIRVVAFPWEGRKMLRGSFTDIRERRRLENTMRQLEAAIASSLSAIAVANLEGNLTYVNQAFLRLWGYEHEREVIGRSAVSFWYEPGDAERVRAELLSSGSWAGELVARHCDGEPRNMTLQTSLFHNSAGEPLGLLASFVDITEERRLQVQLQQAQRLEAVGRLAGGVAHDFNNLLTVMKGNLELMAFESGAHPGLATELHEIEHAVDSAARLTQQLLAFSRKQIIAPRSLDLNHVVQHTLGMLRRLLGENIELRYAAGAGLGRVRFDRGQVEQILVNLAVNARDAMPTGGRLDIETANAVIDDKFAQRHAGMRAGRYVRLTVSDTGAGMTSEIREHAFEPFYTTKRPGEGTGLGLSMIHGAVLQNDGQIVLSSEPGRGTRFDIYFPLDPVQDAEAEPSETSPMHGGRESILLVEDDAPLRRLAERMLRQLGYNVAAKASGGDAIEYLASAEHACDLLLTDVIMPHMNGKMLADQVAILRPGTRVLFMSGYTADVIAQQGVLTPDVHFLAKPFSMQSLATAIRATLDERA